MMTLEENNEPCGLRWSSNSAVNTQDNTIQDSLLSSELLIDTTPVHKRKSEVFSNPFSEVPYDKHHVYQITLQKIFNSQPSCRKVEPSLRRQVCIINTLKELEQAFAAPVDQYNHSSPKRPSLSDSSLPDVEQTISLTDSNMEYTDTSAPCSNPLLSLSHTSNIDPAHEVEPVFQTGLQQEDDFFSDMERGEVSHGRSLIVEKDLPSNRCSFDQFPTSAKNASRSMEDLDSLLQVLVGM